MPLTPEQAAQIKEQLMPQIEKLPDDQRETVKQQIETMSLEEFEQFLIQNKIMKEDGSMPEQLSQEQGGAGGGCIFCAIAQGKTPSHKIDENKTAIAILDINPLSKGHSLVIPKEHASIEKVPSQALTLAKKIAKKIKSKLKPQEVKIETFEVQGHAMINIIPIYKDEKLEKKQASEEDLQKLKKLLEVKKRPQVIKEKKPEKTLIKIPRRIP